MKTFLVAMIASATFLCVTGGAGFAQSLAGWYVMKGSTILAGPFASSGDCSRVRSRTSGASGCEYQNNPQTEQAPQTERGRYRFVSPGAAASEAIRKAQAEAAEEARRQREDARDAELHRAQMDRLRAEQEYREQPATTSPAPPSSVDRPLTGFGFVIVFSPTYDDGRTDYMNLRPYLERQLVQQGWTVLPESDLPKLQADVRMASAALICGIGHTATGGLSNSVTVICNDFFYREVFSLTESGTGFTFKGDLEAAIRNVAQRLRVMRPRFDADRTVDLRETLPTVERTSISDADVDRRIAAGELREPIEGVWSDGDLYRMAILPTERAGEFVGVLLEALPLPSQSFSVWEPGMVKVRLTSSADGSTYLVRWADSLRRQLNGIAALEEGSLSVTLTSPDGGKGTTSFIKLRPRNATSADTGSSSPGPTPTPTPGGPNPKSWP